MSKGILAGMRVVEVSAFVAAPLGGMTLAQMGADVIRIDRPGGGLDYRRWPVTKDNVSLFWAGLNKSKRSVTIDVATDEGRELAQALITSSGENEGILLTNMPARGWLDYEALRERREDLIQLTVQGTRKGESAVDYTINPRMGLPMITGSTDTDGVVNHVLPAWDLICGQMAAVGLLAAERHRRITGEGQHVKLSLEDVALACMAHLGFIAEAEQGVERQRFGNDLYGAFGRDFLTADGESIMVVGLTGKQWKSLVKATDMAGRVADIEAELGVSLDQEGQRFLHRDRIAALLDTWIRARSFSELSKIFDNTGVCWSRYQSVRQLVDADPACSEDNPLFQKIVQPGIGPSLTPRIPLDFGQYRPPSCPAPSLGENTEEVLIEVLGLSSQQFGKLVDKGIL